MHKAVIDTNVMISSLFGGKPAEVMRRWRDGKLTLCLSDGIMAEYLEVLARFERLSASAIDDLLVLFADPQRVILAEPTERIEEVAADPADNMSLECAVAAGADIIISGDSHLLSLGAFRGIPMVSPGDFLQAVAGEP